MEDQTETTRRLHGVQNNDNMSEKVHETSTSFSPMFAPSYSPTWDPKVSVKADYDQYARQPRKNGKNRTNSPKDTAERPKGSQSSDKQDAPKTFSNRRKSEQSDSKSISSNERNDANEKIYSEAVSKEMIKSGESSSKRQRQLSDPEQARMSVTNLPWDKDRTNTDNSPETLLARLDSLPPRKHAKIEQMKLIRDECTEGKSANNSPFVSNNDEKRKAVECDAQGGITSHKGQDNLTFTPPVASVVDFLETPNFPHRVAVVDRNFVDNVFRSGKIDPAILSRLSAKYMVKYLGQGGEPRAKNVVSSMLVRPILPPIRRANQNPGKFTNNDIANVAMDDQVPKTTRKTSQRNPLAAIHRYNQEIQESNVENMEEGDLEPPNADVEDMTYHFRRGTRLRNGESKYVYKPLPHHSTAVLGATTDSPREILNLGGEIENNFDKVIRWKSKMRYCGKPAMYKRITSPTLGEEAIRRKLTDRLPTRQTHKPWPEPSDFYSEQNDKHESWRRPTVTAKAPTLLNANSGAGFRHLKPTLVSTLNPERPVLDAATRHRAVGVTLPPPQLPERKRKPMWQRM